MNEEKDSFFTSLTLTCVIREGFSFERSWNALGKEIKICKGPFLRKLPFLPQLHKILNSHQHNLSTCHGLVLSYMLLRVILTAARILMDREAK